jgi:hypothetical protein
MERGTEEEEEIRVDEEEDEELRQFLRESGGLISSDRSGGVRAGLDKERDTHRKREGKREREVYSRGIPSPERTGGKKARGTGADAKEKKERGGKVCVCVCECVCV